MQIMNKVSTESREPKKPIQFLGTSDESWSGLWQMTTEWQNFVKNVLRYEVEYNHCF